MMNYATISTIWSSSNAIQATPNWRIEAKGTELPDSNTHKLSTAKSIKLLLIELDAGDSTNSAPKNEPRPKDNSTVSLWSLLNNLKLDQA